MSYEPDYIPPPPSQGAPPKQVAMIFVLALALGSFVLYAINESRDSIIEVGAFLIVLGLVFGTGMISKTEIVHFITAGVMMFGGGIAIGLGIRNEQIFWYVGALLFFVCAVIIVIKDQLAES
jgi:peptidoglycan/LPS O-acetylase OafA/YrhL